MHRKCRQVAPSVTFGHTFLEKLEVPSSSQLQKSQVVPAVIFGVTLFAKVPSSSQSQKVPAGGALSDFWTYVF